MWRRLSRWCAVTSVLTLTACKYWSAKATRRDGTPEIGRLSRHCFVYVVVCVFVCFFYKYFRFFHFHAFCFIFSCSFSFFLLFINLHISIILFRRLFLHPSFSLRSIPSSSISSSYLYFSNPSSPPCHLSSHFTFIQQLNLISYLHFWGFIYSCVFPLCYFSVVQDSKHDNSDYKTNVNTETDRCEIGI